MDRDEKGSEDEVKGEVRRVLQTEEIRRIFWGGLFDGLYEFLILFQVNHVTYTRLLTVHANITVTVPTVATSRLC